MPTKFQTLIIALAGLVLGYVLSNPLQFGICTNTYTFGENIRCLKNIVSSVGEFLVQLSFVFLALLAILHFFQTEVFRAWIRLAYWWVPLSALLILAAPAASHSWAIGGFDREGVTWLMNGLFLVISLILITKKHLQLRGK